MDLLITPEYHNLFPEENESVENLLRNVPSLAIIQLLALIDAELHIHGDEINTQIKLTKLMLNRQPTALKIAIMEKALSKNRKNVRLFSRHYNMAFFHYEFTHFRDLNLPEDLTVEQELCIFKAYFLIYEEASREGKIKKEMLPKFDEDYFSKMLWPSLAAQFDLNYRVNPYCTMVRGVVFLNYLQFHTPYSKYVNQYLAQHHKTTSLNYILDICQLLKAAFEAQNNNTGEFAAFFFSKNPEFDSLFQQFSLEIATYSIIYAQDSQSYGGLKSKPLYKMNDGWLVINWDFLANKLYEGLVFDFYTESGIASENTFTKLTDFKRYIASDITENQIFKKLLSSSLKKKHTILLFDNPTIQGFPDAYYRIGNKIFFFELKDAYFPSNAASSYSYEQIVSAIDQKLNSKKKGSGQIIKQLIKLKNNSFENGNKYKNRNVEIYPVIIYTDSIFNMPGVNYYVGRSFRKQLEENNLLVNFKSIKPLTLINLNYFIEIFDLLRNKETSLDKLISNYHSEITKREKKHKRTQEMSDHIAIYDVFEHVMKKFITEPTNRKYIYDVFEILNLKEGLPSD